MKRNVLLFEQFITESVTNEQLAKLLVKNYQVSTDILLKQLDSVPKVILTRDETRTVLNSAFTNSLGSIVAGIQQTTMDGKSKGYNFNVLIDAIIRSFNTLVANKLSGIKGWAVKKMVNQDKFNANTESSKRIIWQNIMNMLDFLSATGKEIEKLDPIVASKITMYYVEFRNYVNQHFEKLSNVLINNVKQKLGFN